MIINCTLNWKKKINCKTEYKLNCNKPEEIQIKKNNFNENEAKSEYIFYITFQ